MSKIEVALCITELNVGGAEKAFSELAIHLDRTRFSVRVYVLRPEKDHGNPSFLPVLREAGVPVSFLNVSGPLSFLRGIGKLARELRAQKADIFLSFMFHANLLGRLAARRTGIPRVYSGIRVSEKEHRLHLLLDRLTSGSVDRYLCVSRSAAEFTQRVGKIPAKKIRVIPNGVDTARLLDSALSPSPLTDRPGRHILFAGRLVWQKGLDRVLKDADAWLGSGEGHDWTFWIVGEGPQKKKLEKIIARLCPETAARIRFTGWRADLPTLLKQSDLFLLPSRYEGMPNVLLEAALAGLPVLCSRCDGVEEILGAQSEEQTFRFGKRDEFLAKIRQLLASETRRAELGAKNRARVGREFTVRKMIDRYEAEFLSPLT
ncbi:MAG: glycosyltransferase [Thermoguttaceae bacterium]